MFVGPRGQPILWPYSSLTSEGSLATEQGLEKCLWFQEGALFSSPTVPSLLGGTQQQDAVGGVLVYQKGHLFAQSYGGVFGGSVWRPIR